MSFRARAYWVDEDDLVRRIPWTRYERIYDRKESMYLFAEKMIRAPQT